MKKSDPSDETGRDRLIHQRGHHPADGRRRAHGDQLTRYNQVEIKHQKIRRNIIDQCVMALNERAIVEFFAFALGDAVFLDFLL